MWASGAFSVFNNAQFNAHHEDAGHSSEDTIDPQSAQSVLKGHTLLAETEEVNPPSEDFPTSSVMNDDWMAQCPAARHDPSISPFFQHDYDFSTMLNQNHRSSIFDGITTYPVNMNGTMQCDHGPDCSLTVLDHISLAGTPNFSTFRPSTDATEVSPGSFVDLDTQTLPFDNAAFLYHNPLGPTAPLSPAPTPPSSHTARPAHEDSPPAFSSDDQRWQATLARSRQADKSFLYGVTSTKIFCRPSCPSRRASRANITFFPFPGAIEAAHSASFRPCKRCKPETLGTADTGVLGVIKVLRLIIADANAPFSSTTGRDTKLESLAEEAKLSPFHFHRLFKATTQLTPGEFLAGCRALALGDALAQDNHIIDNDTQQRLPINVPALITASAKWTHRNARKALGAISALDYAKGAPGLRIQYLSIDTVVSSYGPVSVAYSASSSSTSSSSSGGGGGSDNIHAVLLGSDAEERIRARFPGVVAGGGGMETDPDSDTYTHQDENGLERCVRELVLLDRAQGGGNHREVDIPEDVKPVVWRVRVWVWLVREGGLGRRWRGRGV